MSETFGMLPPAPMTEAERARDLEGEMLAREWFAPLRTEFEERFARLNDPSTFLRELHELIAVSCNGYETREVVLYMLEKSEWMLELLNSEIPHVPDIALVVLLDCAVLAPEYGEEIAANVLDEKLHERKSDIEEMYMSNESLARADFGLRLSALSRLHHYGRFYAYRKREALMKTMPESLEELQRGVIAMKDGRVIEEESQIAALTLMIAPIPLDKKTGQFTNTLFNDSLLDDVIQGIPREALDEVAYGISVRFDAPLDMRLQRNAHLSKEEQEVRHYVHIRDWIWKVLCLEQHARGACEELRTRFGIKNFHHIPLVVLKDMYDNRDKDVPFGVVILPEYDWNDALVPHESHIKDHQPILRQMYEQLKEKGMHMRVLEVRTKREYAKRIAEVRKDYGDKHKFSFVFMQAHAGEEEIQIGNEFEEQIKKKDILALRTGHLNDYLEEGADIVFNSCYVGEQAGFAEAVAQNTSARVIAPKGIFHGYKSVTLTWEGALPRFTVTPCREEEAVMIYQKSH